MSCFIIDLEYLLGMFLIIRVVFPSSLILEGTISNIFDSFSTWHFFLPLLLLPLLDSEGVLELFVIMEVDIWLFLEDEFMDASLTPESLLFLDMEQSLLMPGYEE